MSATPIAEFRARLERLEAESAVRRLIARYFELCDDLGPHTPIGELAGLFTRDARWEGKGRYLKAFGAYDGRKAIADMLWSYCSPSAHFALTAHFLSSESIRINDDGADGRWMMLQTSTYADGRCDLRSAVLKVRFAVEEGAWRIAHFQSLNIFSRRVGHWTDAADIPVPQMSNDGG